MSGSGSGRKVGAPALLCSTSHVVLVSIGPVCLKVRATVSPLYRPGLPPIQSRLVGSTMKACAMASRENSSGARRISTLCSRINIQDSNEVAQRIQEVQAYKGEAACCPGRVVADTRHETRDDSGTHPIYYPTASHWWKAQPPSLLSSDFKCKRRAQSSDAQQGATQEDKCGTRRWLGGPCAKDPR